MANKFSKAIGTFFYGEEADGKNEVQTTTVQQGQNVAQAQQVYVPVTQIQVQGPNTSGAVDNSTIAAIWESVSAKSEGSRYTTLRETAQTLIGIIQDETLRLQAAFNVLRGKNSNLSNKDLIASVESCIDEVNRQKEMGLEQCQEKIKAEVDSKNAEAESVKAQADDVMKEIDELKAKHESLLNEARNLEIEAVNAANEIGQRKDIFINSINAVLNQLEADKVKIANLAILNQTQQ